MEIANELGIEVIEKNIEKEELFEADELFFTGTATEVVAVVSIDKKEINTGTPGEKTNQIRNKYLEIVNRQDEKYFDYLTSVQ